MFGSGQPSLLLLYDDRAKGISWEPTLLRSTWRLDISWTDEATLGPRMSHPQSWPKATAAAFGRSRRARRPRSQGGFVKHTLRLESACSAHEACPCVGSVLWTAAASAARRRFGLDGKAGNLIQSFRSGTERKRRSRSALPAHSK